jgi:hypothetical protein
LIIKQIYEGVKKMIPLLQIFLRFLEGSAHCKGVFGLVFGSGFCPIKAKSQPKGWIQEAAFSKSRLSHSAKLKAPLDLLLVAFGWNCENIYRRTFNDF